MHGWLNAVNFVNTKVGWAVGGRQSSGGSGLVLKTVDGGLSWTVQKASADSELLDVSAVGTKRAWASSASGRMWRTINGGSLWGEVGPSFNDSVDAVVFHDRHLGRAAGSEMIWRTVDGGSTWTIQLGSSGTFYSFSDLAFVDALNGWAVGRNGACFHTTDGGAHWAAEAVASAGWDCISASGVSTAVVAGADGQLGRTTDAGGTWTSLPAAAGNFHSSLNAIDFVDTTSGWAIGGAPAAAGGLATSAILHTANGGQTWAGQSAPTLAPLYDVWFSDTANGWDVGAGGAIVHTANGGASSTAQASGTTADLSGVFFFGATQGWAVGTEYHPDLALVPVVRHTADGGAHWTVLPAPLPDYCALYDVSFSDALNGWAVGWAAGDGNGEPAVVFHTSNGGATWTQQISYIPPVSHSVGSASLQAVACIDAFHAVAVGYADNADAARPLIFRTADGGVTWQRMNAPGPWPAGGSRLNDICFADSLHGWATGSSGTILRTANGGLSWARQRSGVAGNLAGVSFVSPTQGWVAGDAGAILSTTSGGRTP